MADTQTAEVTDIDSGADVLGVPPTTGNNSDDSGAFFEALDREVNNVVYDEPSQLTSEQPLDNNREQSPVDGQAVEQQEVSNNTEADNVQQRYAASSREAKRLSGRLKELEPYVPILDAMKEDPSLIKHVRNYFEGGGNAPKSMKEELQLDEDFMFDGGEAFENPDSDSAKVLNATIDGLVQRRLSQHAQHQKAENIRLNNESEFRAKYDMDDDQWNEFKDFAQNNKLGLEDIYYLKNRGAREKNIQKNTQRQVAQQMENVRQRPQSLSSTGSSESVPKSDDDVVFDTLLGGDNVNRLLG